MDREARLKRLQFRSWHRGTKEADFLMGGFYDRFAATWSAEEIEWYEALLEQEDVDIMAWAIGTLPVPDAFQGAMMARMQQLDYIEISK